MARRRSTVELMVVLTVAVLGVSCAVPTMQAPSMLRSSPLMVSLPSDIRQMAILYPRGGTADWTSAYGRLEVAAFQLKSFRPNLRIIDRSHMQAIVSEQRFQVGGLVSEDSAVRIGQMLGVDSVLIYQIVVTASVEEIEGSSWSLSDNV